MKKLKRSDVSGIENSETSTKKRTLIGVLLASAVAVAAFILYKKQSNGSNVSIDTSSLTNNRKNRTDSQLIALAQSLNELYSIHGKSLAGDELRDALQEFLDLENSKHSHEAFRIIETRLALESKKPLEYGQRYGLYGFDQTPHYLIK